MNKEQYFQTVDNNIKEYGCHLTYVFEEDNTPSFCYSTGLDFNYNIPEIIISGLPQNLSFNLINQYADKYKNSTTAIPLGIKLTDIESRFPIMFHNVEDNILNDHVLTSVHFYKNRPYKYLQLVYPDTNGLFPNEEKYQYPQELFFT